MSQETLPHPDVRAETGRPGTIRFPQGLLGFPDILEYELGPGPGEGLYWLVGSGEETPRFLVSDPFAFFEGYELDLTPEQARSIEADDASQVGVLAITVPSREGAWTANLQGPIVINAAKGIAAQLVLPGDEPGLRRPFQPVLVSAA